MTRLLPSRNEIHLYRFRLDISDQERAALRTLLNSEELARADRFCFEHSRQQFTVARARLRQTLAACLEVAPEQLEFELAEHGKPHLAMPDSLRFNLSHSGDQMLLAISQNVELGVDIETVKPDSEIERLALRFFAPAETEAMMALEGHQRRQAFFACWTRKEAIIKAHGDGLSFGLDRFTVDVLSCEGQLLVSSGAADFSNWSLFDVAVPAGYRGAVAAAATGMQIVEMESAE